MINKTVPALIQSVAKSNKGKSKPTIRKAFLSNNPGKNALAVKSAMVEFRCVGLVESDDTFEILDVVSRYSCEINKKLKECFQNLTFWSN